MKQQGAPMRHVLLGLIVVVSATALGGCYNHRLNVGTGAPKGRVVYEKWHSYYFFGAFGDPQIDLGKLCPSGNSTISRHVSFENDLARIFTLGLYSPMTVVVKCAPATGGKSE
jgi:hypothetical protein